jgi:hypothetical protein
MRRKFLIALILLACSPATGQAAPPHNAQKSTTICAACIRAHEEFLASDALQGRGSATHDELVAATYIASELRQYGIDPAGDEGTYIQQAVIPQAMPASPNTVGQTEPDKASTPIPTLYTWNVVAVLPGRDPLLRNSAVLLSAHLDHLGIGASVNGDNIYNGADDDASGVTAVLELARVLGRGPRPQRTVLFAFFGSEELGGLGSTFFREHPPLPLKNIAVNVEFEMLGRRDPSIGRDQLWLTGWERTNLGPALAAHGAKLVADPHPEQRFFTRSDNFILAKAGVIAQTVSSYGLHADYHQPSDDLARLDFKHMDFAIASLIAPIAWLVNSDFQPRWKPGGQPSQ